MTRRAKRAGEGERSWSLYSTLPSSDSGTRRGIVGEERLEESGEVCVSVWMCPLRKALEREMRVPWGWEAFEIV